MIELAVVLGSVIVAAAATVSSLRAESRLVEHEAPLERVRASAAVTSVR